MKKTTFSKSLAMLILSICIIGQSFAQSIDQNKMDKDIKVAEDVLLSLMKADSENTFFMSSGPKGMYVPEYGVIFSLSNSRAPYLENIHIDMEDFNFNFDFDFNDSFVIDTEEIARKAEMIAREAQKMAEIETDMLIEEERLMEEAEELRKEAEKLAREATKAANKAEKRKNTKDKNKPDKDDEDDEDDEEIDSDNEVYIYVDPHGRRHKKSAIVNPGGHGNWFNKKADYKPVMTDFLVDYARLISQLSPNQKIMLSAGQRSSSDHEDKSPVKLTAELSKKDINSYQQGKLSREELVKKIVFNEVKDGSKNEKDLILLGDMMKTLYKSNFSDTYYLANRVGMERLNNFGVIYSMKVYSSTSYNGKHSIPTLDLEGLSQEERDKKVEALYPKFEKGLKENILDYGKTIKSLGANEMVLFQVKLTECKGCNMPENIDVSVKQSVLSDYDSGKLNKSDALAKINVKKYNK